MYRTWLSEEEYEFLKTKVELQLMKADEEDNVIFVDCLNLDNWKILNEYLAVKIK